MKKTALVAFLVLCMALTVLLSSCFDEESRETINKIVTGDHDVEIYYKQNATDSWTRVTDFDKLFDDDVVWEPGYTQVLHLKIVNKESYPLKYVLGINIVSETKGTNVYGDKFKCSDYVEFGVVRSAQEGFFEDRSSLRSAITSPKLISDTTIDKYTLPSCPAEEYVTVAVYMPETVDQEANYKVNTSSPKLKLGIEFCVLYEEG